MAEAARRAALGALAAMGFVPVGAAPASVFDFALPALEGGTLDLGAFRGRPLLVVNTASFCGFTPQYAALQRLHDRYAAQGFAVIGVPSNDFQQESRDAAAIKKFCEGNFGITFPMTMPQHVRGAPAAPLFAFLAAQGGGPPRWNFHKYLVARDGRTVRAFPTSVEPDAREVLRAIEAALAAPVA